MSIALISGGIVVGMALLYDSSSTVKLVTVVIGIRGVTWLVQKITSSINPEASEIINFTGWSVAGVSIAGIIQNAMGSVAEITAVVTNITNSVNRVGSFLERMAEYADKIIFWS